MTGWLNPKSAFTLIELLVVISVIAILLALLLPALDNARRAAKVTMCAINLKSYAMGLTVYASDDGDGHYPAHSLGYQTTARSIYGSGVPIYANTFPNPDAYLTMYRDVVCGGDMRILWCPLHTYWDNPTRPDLYALQTDPNFPLLEL